MPSSYSKHVHTNGWDANSIVRWSCHCPWMAIARIFQGFTRYTQFVVGDGEGICFWVGLWWGDQPLGSQFPRLFRIVIIRNLLVSSILGFTYPFSWNLNFHLNLFDFEREDLERLMPSFYHLHLSSSIPNAKAWSLSFSSLFIVIQVYL